MKTEPGLPRAAHRRTLLRCRFGGLTGLGEGSLCVLYILDNRKNIHMTGLRSANELPALLNYLRLQAPDVLFRPTVHF